MEPTSIASGFPADSVRRCKRWRRGGPVTGLRSAEKLFEELLIGSNVAHMSRAIRRLANTTPKALRQGP